jgi:hypothetical protein
VLGLGGHNPEDDMKRLCVLAIAATLFAFSYSGAAAPSGDPGQGFEPDPRCVPHWVVVGSGHGYACHEEAPYWVATYTSWLYFEDDECNRPSRSECHESYHPDYLYGSYEECCADWGGCAVCACNQ